MPPLIITVHDWRIAYGKPTNIPLEGVLHTWEARQVAAGAQVSPEQQERAIQHAVRRLQEGQVFPSFETLTDATVAAEEEQRQWRGPGGLPMAPPMAGEVRPTPAETDVTPLPQSFLHRPRSRW